MVPQMSNDFEKLIRDAAPEVPDPGESRRTNRAVLLARIEESRAHRRRTGPLKMAAASLALLVLFSGQVSELGSNAFEFRSELWERPDGKIIPEQRAVFGTEVITVSSPEIARGLLENILSGQYEIFRIFGTEIEGKISWLVRTTSEVNGETQYSSLPDGLPSTQITDLHNKFMGSPHFAQMMDVVHSSEPQSEVFQVLDGIPLNMKTWEFEYPGYGSVFYHRGTPVEETD